METAKLNGLDPQAYLREVLTRIADHPIYMNASRLRRVFVLATNRRVAALYPALLQPDVLRAPMKSADSHLIQPTSSKLLIGSRFSESRSNLFCHHTRLPTQPLDVSPVNV